MRRWLAALLAGAVVGGVLTAVSPAVTLAHASPPAPVASPASPLRGERFSVSGKLSTKIVRPVRLQVRSGKKWKTVASGKTDATGSYSLAMSSKASSVKVRVSAPKVKVHGKKYKAITTKTRTIKPAKAAQTAKLAMPSSAQVTEAVNATLSFTPARTGRPVRLEAWVAGAWAAVASGVETNSGTTVLPLTATTIGTFTYRATAPLWNGLAATSSTAVKLAVTASRITIPDTTRPLTDAEAAAITSYDATSGTVVLNGAPASLAQVVAGDAITIPPRAGITSGALRKVTKVTNTGSTTTLTTEDTDLPSVIQNIPDDTSDIGLSVVSSEFTPVDGVTVESVPAASKSVGPSGLRPASVGELKLKLGADVKLDQASVGLSGELSIQPQLVLQLGVSWFKLTSYKIGASVQVANTATIKAGFTATATQKIPLGHLTQILAGAIGPVPVWVQNDLQVILELSEEGSISVTTQVSQTGTISAGITNTSSSDLTPTVYTSRANVTGALTEATASGKITAFLGPELSMQLYSAVGPYGRLGAQADAELSIGTSTGSTCTLEYGPHAEFGLKTSDALKMLTGHQFKVATKVDIALSTLNVCPTGTGGGGGGTTPLAITTSSLPAGTVGTAYTATLAATGGSGGYTWSATGLPAGLSLDATTGVISGTPSLAGGFTFTVTVTDNTGISRQNVFAVTVIGGASDTVAVAITAGYAHTCAITSSGAVKCWGENLYGELGDGTTTSSTVPVQVSGLTSGVTSIAAGGEHTCAVTNVGAVKCWGRNADGELGDGTTTSSTVPVQVSGLVSGVTAITAGYGGHTCAVTGGGAVKCWGLNGGGQLGDGTTNDSTVPVQVSGLVSGVTAVTAGGAQTCAVTGGGAVECWGVNGAGQLGDGTAANSTVPVQVSGLVSGVTAVTAGGAQTCAVTNVGAVKCWGRNADGELGDGTAANSKVPVQVSGLVSGVTAIAAGYYHTCAVADGGAVKCWGLNWDGKLGDVTTSSRVPVQVSGLVSGVTAIAAGLSYTCAVAGGGVKCWGRNWDGQLGDGTTTSSSIPVQVSGLGG